jgi:hypothetical protein
MIFQSFYGNKDKQHLSFDNPFASYNPNNVFAIRITSVDADLFRKAIESPKRKVGFPTKA